MKVQESRENYLEAILVLNQTNGYARSIDIANYLEFSKPSVSVAMANLRSAKLIEVNDGGRITLTEAGRCIAEQVYDRHKTFTRFLMMLGVDESTAADDACRIEHVLTNISFEQIKKLTALLSDGVITLPEGFTDIAEADELIEKQ